MRGLRKKRVDECPAENAHFEYGWIGIFRTTDRKIVEAWIQEDNLWMMQQMGLELRPAGTDT